MGVSPELHTDNVLVTFHQGTETASRLVLEISRLNVANKVSYSSSFLNSTEFVFKPLHVVSRVFFHSKHPPVLLVHGLSVDGNNLSSRGNQSSIRFLKVSDEIPVFSKLINCVLSNPFDPRVFKSVDVVVAVRVSKVLYVDRPSVVVTLGGVDSDRSILEGSFNHLSNLEGVVGHLF